MQQTGGIGIWPSTAILIVTADSSFSVGQGLGHLIEVPVCLGILVKLLAAPWHSSFFWLPNTRVKGPYLLSVETGSPIHPGATILQRIGTLEAKPEFPACTSSCLVVCSTKPGVGG